MVLDAAAQVERIGQAVAGDLPALRQSGDHVAALVDPGQAFEQVGVGHLVDRRRGTRRRVQMRRLQLHADHDAASVLSGCLAGSHDRRYKSGRMRRRTSGQKHGKGFHSARLHWPFFAGHDGGRIGADQARRRVQAAGLQSSALAVLLPKPRSVAASSAI